MKKDHDRKKGGAENLSSRAFALNRRSVLQLTAAAVAAVGLGAANAQDAVPAPKEGGILQMGYPADLRALGRMTGSANTHTVFGAVLESLIAYDDERQPQPVLAESWEVSSDFREYTFNLRKGVTFHSGREFTSEDVRFTLIRARDRTVSGPQLATMSNWWTDIETPDPHTVILRSDLPRPAAFDLLDFMYIRDEPSMTQNPDAVLIGTGPFQLVDYQPGTSAKLRRNPDYWNEDQPYLDGIDLQLVGDVQTLALQLESGAVDLAINLAIPDAVRLTEGGEYALSMAPAAPATYMVGINTTIAPFDNKEVRQALNYAFDRDRVATSVMKDLVPAIVLPWPENSPAYDANLNNAYGFDLAKAKALLDQAGVTDLTADFLYSGSRAELASVAQIYQADLASIGVNLNIKPLQRAAFASATNAREFSGLASSITAFTQYEPSSWAALSVWAGRNEGFDSPEYRSLLESAFTATEPEAISEIYDKLNQLLIDESFFIAFVPLPHFAVTRSKIQGLSWRLSGAPRYERLWLE